MFKTLCSKCKEIILLKNGCRKYDSKIHHIFCDLCSLDLKVCSKSKCKQIFLLKESDVKNLKHIYIQNNKNENKFYLYNEVENLIINKYGSLDNLKQKLKEKKDLIDIKNKGRERIYETRERKIRKVFQQNKLEFKNHGDCYSYIMYGYPSIDKILENEMKRIQQLSEKRIQLAEKLSEKGLPFIEDNPECYKYINGIGCITEADVIRSVEIYQFLINNTDYKKLLTKYSDTKARDLAIRRFIKNKKNLPDILTEDIVVEFF